MPSLPWLWHLKTLHVGELLAHLGNSIRGVYQSNAWDGKIPIVEAVIDVPDEPQGG